MGEGKSMSHWLCIPDYLPPISGSSILALLPPVVCLNFKSVPRENDKEGKFSSAAVMFLASCLWTTLMGFYFLNSKTMSDLEWRFKLYYFSYLSSSIISLLVVIDAYRGWWRQTVTKAWANIALICSLAGTLVLIFSALRFQRAW